MKLCIDCKHHMRYTQYNGDAGHMCYAKAIRRISSLDGSSYHSGYTTCKVERIDSHLDDPSCCGIEGAFFQRKPWWRFW